MKRLIAAPVGTVEVDVFGTGDYLFVTVCRFDADGWAVTEEMWSSNQDRPLEQFLSAEAGFSDAEAEGHASALLAAFDERGGPAEGAAAKRNFTLAIAGGLAAVALVAVLLTVGVLAVFR
jgi:hypothetical protein